MSYMIQEWNDEIEGYMYLENFDDGDSEWSPDMEDAYLFDNKSSAREVAKLCRLDESATEIVGYPL